MYILTWRLSRNSWWGRKKGGFIIISMQIIICSSKLKWIENVYTFGQLADQIHTYSKNSRWLYDAFKHDKIQNYWMNASVTSQALTYRSYLSTCICDQNHLLHVHLYNLQVIVFFRTSLLSVSDLVFSYKWVWAIVEQ